MRNNKQAKGTWKRGRKSQRFSSGPCPQRAARGERADRRRAPRVGCREGPVQCLGARTWGVRDCERSHVGSQARSPASDRVGVTRRNRRFRLRDPPNRLWSALHVGESRGKVRKCSPSEWTSAINFRESFFVLCHLRCKKQK